MKVFKCLHQFHLLVVTGWPDEQLRKTTSPLSWQILSITMFQALFCCLLLVCMQVDSFQRAYQKILAPRWLGSLRSGTVHINSHSLLTNFIISCWSLGPTPKTLCVTLATEGMCKDGVCGSKSLEEICQLQWCLEVRFWTSGSLSQALHGKGTYVGSVQSVLSCGTV